MAIRPIQIILILAMLIGIVSAIPVPLGVDGRVYGLDGITPADSTVRFSIENTRTGWSIYSRLRADGTYSAALPGIEGDTFQIIFWTDWNSVTLTRQIDGVLHNNNAILNLSHPYQGPVFTSVPIESALEDTLYAYEATTDSMALLSLIQGPASMHLNGSMVFWLPGDADVGIHHIKISAYDNISTSYQEYDLEIIPVND
ncbi:MAG: hypothetical protein HGA85_03180, partial [Nanoarchaeota archaeon]|nr:hypothetical protein [Nanoarchaeota archaeon]